MSTILTPAESDRLNLIRFPLIVGVVFIHTYSIEAGSGSTTNIVKENYTAASDFIRILISQGFSRVAVPTFFLISGFLFFQYSDWNLKTYFRKIKDRIKTLLVPMVAWNLITILIFATAQSIPPVRVYFSGKSELIGDYKTFDYINATFGLTRFPIAYQFWFIRDLMIVSMMAPLIHFLRRARIDFPIILCLAIVWISGIAPNITPSIDAILFFMIGSHLALKKVSPFIVDRFGSSFTIAYLSLATICSWFYFEPFREYLHKIGIFIGVAAALHVTRLASPGSTQFVHLQKWGLASFFVFAIHEPLLTVLKKLIPVTANIGNASASLVTYFAAPIMAIGIGLVMHHGISRHWPSALTVLSGRKYPNKAFSEQ